MTAAEIARARTPMAVGATTVAFWLSLGLVLASSIALGGNRPLPWLVLALGAGGALAVHVLARRHPTPSAVRRVWPAAVAILAVSVWGVVQAQYLGIAPHPAYSSLPGPGAISPDPWASRQAVLRLCTYCALFWIAASVRSGTIQRALDVIAIFAGLSAAYALGALILGVNPVTGPSAYPGSATGSFVNRNAFALYSGFGAMVCLAALASGGKARPRRACLGLCLALTLLALAQTGSRAGVAASLAGLATMVVILGRAQLAWGLAALLVGGAVLGAGAPLASRLEQNPFLDQRLTVYDLVVQAIAERPWVGHGFGAFQDAFRAYIPPGFSGSDWDHAHNSYLEAAFELGVPGAVVLFLGFAWIACGLVSGFRRRRRMRPVIAAGLGASLAGALHAGVDFSLQMPATAGLYAMIMGLAWAAANPEDHPA